MRIQSRKMVDLNFITPPLQHHSIPPPLPLHARRHLKLGPTHRGAHSEVVRLELVGLLSEAMQGVALLGLLKAKRLSLLSALLS